MAYSLSKKQQEQNLEQFIGIIDQFNTDRREKLHKLYDSLDENWIYAPASGFEHFHNAIAGGYIDHVVRVHDFALKVYAFWQQQGMDCDNITQEEVSFAALNHDLGKLGYPGEGNLQYVYNDSAWHRKNQGKLYAINQNIPFMTVPDRSIFLLQQFNIDITYNEYIAIKVHDGLYDETNKPYLISRVPTSRPRSYLPYILHYADQMATLKESQTWNELEHKLPRYIPGKQHSTQSQPSTKKGGGDLMSAFDNIFND